MITASMAVEDKVLWDEIRFSLKGEPVQIDCAQPQVSDLSPFVESLNRSHPEIVFVDVGSLREPIEPALTRVRAASPDSFLVAVNTHAEAGQLLECFHGGANEYLIPPVHEGIRKAVHQRLEGLRRNDRKRGKVVAFLSAKGGCGATTVACHVAAEISRLNQKVLIADFDMGSGMVGFTMGSDSRYSIADAFANTHRLDDSYWSALVAHHRHDLDVIVAPAGVEARRSPSPESVRLVHEYARGSYDWILTDLGRGLTPFVMASLDNADALCLIVEPHLPALNQAKAINQTLMDSGYSPERIHLVLNRVARRMDMEAADIRKLLGVSIFAALKDREDELREALSEGKLLPSATELGRQFAHLSNKLMGRQEAAKRPFWFMGKEARS